MEDIKKHYVVKKESDIAWDRIEEDVFIILTRKNEEKVFKLNKTAGFLWENCDGKKTIQDLVKILCKQFDVNEEEALADIRVFVDQMKNMHLISLSVPGT